MGLNIGVEGGLAAPAGASCGCVGRCVKEAVAEKSLAPLQCEPPGLVTPRSTGGCSPLNPVLQKHGKYTPLKNLPGRRCNCRAAVITRCKHEVPEGKGVAEPVAPYGPGLPQGRHQGVCSAGGDTTSSLLGSSPWAQGGYFLLFPVQAAVSAVQCNPGNIWAGLNVL